MIMKRSVAVLLSCGVVAIACNKSRPADEARVCRSYCAFVSDEISDANFYAGLAASTESFATNVHPANDDEAKLMGDAARRSCVQIHEALAIVDSDLLALKGAHTITSTTPIDMERKGSGLWVEGDCIAASPAQLRSLEKTVQDAKKRIPSDDPQCEEKCQKDMAAKLAP